jgi:hypothetical protein
MKIEDVTERMNAKFEMVLNHDNEWFNADRGLTT